MMNSIYQPMNALNKTQYSTNPKTQFMTGITFYTSLLYTALQHPT